MGVDRRAEPRVHFGEPRRQRAVERHADHDARHADVAVAEDLQRREHEADGDEDRDEPVVGYHDGEHAREGQDAADSITRRALPVVVGMRRGVEEGGADGPLLGPGDERERDAHGDHRADDDEHLVLEDAGALDLAALLHRVGGPLQARPHDRRGEKDGTERDLRVQVDAGYAGDVLEQPLVVALPAVDHAGPVVDVDRELCRVGAQELHDQDDHEDAGCGEHEVLQAHVVLEAGDKKDRHRGGADDADGDHAGGD